MNGFGFRIAQDPSPDSLDEINTTACQVGCAVGIDSCKAACSFCFGCCSGACELGRQPCLDSCGNSLELAEVKKKRVTKAA